MNMNASEGHGGNNYVLSCRKTPAGYDIHLPCSRKYKKEEREMKSGGIQAHNCHIGRKLAFYFTLKRILVSLCLFQMTLHECIYQIYLGHIKSNSHKRSYSMTIGASFTVTGPTT